MKTFKAKEVMDILGIRKSRIQFYVDQKIIFPAVDSDGPGTFRLFSEQNIVEISIVMALTQLGLGIELIRDILTKIREKDKKHSKEWYLGIPLPEEDFGKYSIFDPSKETSFSEYLCIMIQLDEALSPVYVNILPVKEDTTVKVNWRTTSPYTILVNLSKIVDEIKTKLKTTS